MSRVYQPWQREGGSLALCVLLSLLLHAGLAWALDWLPRGRGTPPRHPVAAATRHVQLRRAAPAPKPAATPPAPEPEAPFAKTSADERQRRPKEADFVGSRNSVASGDDEGPQRRSEAPLPSMAGRESEEVVTFDQERRDGELEHEGHHAPEPPAPQPLAQGRPDAEAEVPEPTGEGTTAPQPAPLATAAREPEPPAPGEGLRLGELHTEEALTLAPQLPPPAPLGQPEGVEGTATQAPPRHTRAAVYDPALAANAQQPGLRTYERRTRSTGRFIFGRRPSLNVAATARGRYEAEIYRRIARMWYAACDDHRGDIIPGSITVSLRLTKNGRIESMDLVKRSGASLIQQSFSFGAIRRAALPPMPAEVQQELIGRLYEMILTFNFD